MHAGHLRTREERLRGALERRRGEPVFAGKRRADYLLVGRVARVGALLIPHVYGALVNTGGRHLYVSWDSRRSEPYPLTVRRIAGDIPFHPEWVYNFLPGASAILSRPVASRLDDLLAELKTLYTS